MSPGLAFLGAASLVTAWMLYIERLDRSELMQLFSRHVSDAVAEEIWKRRKEFFIEYRVRDTNTIVTTPTQEFGSNEPGSDESFTDFQTVTSFEDTNSISFLSFAYPFKRKHAVKLGISEGVVTESGGDFRTINLNYVYRIR